MTIPPSLGRFRGRLKEHSPLLSVPSSSACHVRCFATKKESSLEAAVAHHVGEVTQVVRPS
jgi:hypothetical protein